MQPRLFLLLLGVLSFHFLHAQGPISSEVKALNRFTIDFGLEMGKEAKKDYIFSGISLQQALLMAYFGTEGVTKKEFESTLDVNKENAIKHVALGINLQKDNTEAYYFKVANKVWVDKREVLSPIYQQEVQKTFGADIGTVDFDEGSEAAQIINTWTSEKTEGLIKEVVESPDVYRAGVVLTNAVVFNALWHAKFDSTNTQKRPFHKEDGTTKEIPFMQGEQGVGVVTANSYTGYAVPFQGFKRSLYVMLPHEGVKLKDLEGELRKEETFSAAQDALDMSGNMREVELFLPKFKLETALNATDVLRNIGLEKSFSGMGNFTGISPGAQFNKVLHKAFIQVEEDGVKAAAVTVVTVTRGSSPELRIDRPFYYFLLDHETGAILFMGRFMGSKL